MRLLEYPHNRCSRRPSSIFRLWNRNRDHGESIRYSRSLDSTVTLCKNGSGTYSVGLHSHILLCYDLHMFTQTTQKEIQKLKKEVETLWQVIGDERLWHPSVIREIQRRSRTARRDHIKGRLRLASEVFAKLHHS